MDTSELYIALVNGKPLFLIGEFSGEDYRLWRRSLEPWVVKLIESESQSIAFDLPNTEADFIPLELITEKEIIRRLSSQEADVYADIYNRFLSLKNSEFWRSQGLSEQDLNSMEAQFEKAQQGSQS